MAGAGKTAEWKSQALRPISAGTLAADALIASTYLAAPIQGGCVARWRPCSAGQWARTP
jgi:hypothetical protein